MGKEKQEFWRGKKEGKTELKRNTKKKKLLFTDVTQKLSKNNFFFTFYMTVFKLFFFFFLFLFLICFFFLSLLNDALS